MKNCPHCNREIKDSVIRCVHCGLDPRVPAGTIAPAAASPDPVASDLTNPSIPVSAQFTPPVARVPEDAPTGAPVPAIPPPPPTQPSATGQPAYFAMKTDLTPPGGPRQHGSSSSSRSDPAGSAFVAGILGIVGAALAGAGMFLVPFLTASWGGTIDWGAASGGPQEIPHEEIILKLAQTEGFAKNLLMVATVGAVVVAIMVLTNPDRRSVSWLLGQGILMTGTSVWIAAQLEGLRQQMTDAFNLALSWASSQILEDAPQQFPDQAAELLTIKAGMGIWLVILGSLVVMGGSILGGLALKKAQPYSNL